MLMGKLYAMLIYGIEGAKGRTLAYHWTSLLSIAIVIWGLFGVTSVMGAIEAPGIGSIALAVLIVVSLPILLFFLCRWGRKQVDAA